MEENSGTKMKICVSAFGLSTCPTDEKQGLRSYEDMLVKEMPEVEQRKWMRLREKKIDLSGR